jgi:ribosomal protein S12 methylthiotransferase accessory factor
MDMEINFPGGKKVTSTYNGFTVTTDLPKNEGGDEEAPAPFDLFLASIGTCAGVFVVFFCDSRKIPTDDIRILLRFDRDEKSYLMKKIDIDIYLPPGFPDKYRKGVIKVVEMCTVKRNLVEPPIIQVNDMS